MYHNRVRFSILVLIEVLRLQESSCKVVVIQLSTLVSPTIELSFQPSGEPFGVDSAVVTGRQGLIIQCGRSGVGPGKPVGNPPSLSEVSGQFRATIWRTDPDQTLSLCPLLGGTHLSWFRFLVCMGGILECIPCLGSSPPSAHATPVLRK